MSLFDDATLVEDADLTAWESRMPELGKKFKAASGSSAYDSKRVLAKSFLGKQLLKRGVDLDSLSEPAQLKDAATFKELELIFQDMSQSPDDLAAKKAAHYAGLFDSELELVLLKVANSTQTVSATITSIPLLRA